MEINFEKEKKTKPYTVETIPKSYRTILETEANSILLTHIYMNAHFLGLVPTLQ
jgi:hypothetical protein